MAVILQRKRKPQRSVITAGFVNFVHLLSEY